MHRFYFLFLFQFVFTGKLTAQNQFDQQHEKFIRLHRITDMNTLHAILQAQERLIDRKKTAVTNLRKAKLALERGIYFYLIDDYEKGIAAFERVVQYNCLTSDRDQTLLYTYLGVSYRNALEDYRKSHFYFDKAILSAKKAKDNNLLASAIAKKADTYYYQEQIDEGVRLMESFIREKESSINIEWKIGIHNRLAQGNVRLGAYSSAYRHYTSAIELAEETNDDVLLADQYHNLTHYFLEQQRYKEAEGQELRAIRVLKNKPNKTPEEEQALHYYYYPVLAQIYSSLNKPDSALYYATISHAYALKTQNEEMLAFAQGTLGQIYDERKEYAKALQYLLKAAAYQERFMGLSDLASYYHNIGVVYLKMKNYRQAIVYFDKSNQQSYLAGDIYSLQLNYGDLAKSRQALGDFEQALALSDSAFLYYDSLNNLENKKELLFLETRYKTQLKEEENKLLKLEVRRQNDLKEKEKKARRDTLLLSLVVILLLSGVVYILFISNRLKKSKVAEATARIQNQQLEEELLLQRLHLLTEEINGKNQLIESLENGANTLAEESLINKVTLENDWLAFMSEFDKIHQGYLADLKDRFPALTTNNLRIAALVKLEFSNKEIAVIMSITENGVKKAKQRLKERTASD